MKSIKESDGIYNIFSKKVRNLSKPRLDNNEV